MNSKEKTTRNFFILLILVSASWTATAQEVALQTDAVRGKTHISREDFPKGKLINMVHGWGGMTVAINEPIAGTDFTPLLQGLKDNLCQVPHWGYLEKGRIRIINEEGDTALVTGGSVFYMPPGHTVIVEEDARIIDFSPENQMKELNEHVLEKVAQMKEK